MFLVFNKQKIYSYIVALSTVMLLLGVAMYIEKDNNQTISTSSKVENKLPIYSVETEEKNIALTINCAWNADDINSILDTLSKNQVKVTLFVVGDWVDKYPEAVKKISENGHEIRKSF